jgi:hypothetical protein
MRIDANFITSSPDESSKLTPISRTGIHSHRPTGSVAQRWPFFILIPLRIQFKRHSQIAANRQRLHSNGSIGSDPSISTPLYLSAPAPDHSR